MTEIKKYLDNLLAASARLFFRNRLKTLFVILLLTGGLVSHLLQITINTATEGYLEKNDPELVDFREFIDQFGRDLQDVVIAVKTPDLFDLNFLAKLKSLHDELEENVPYLANIVSLINARSIRSESDTLIVDELFQKWPQTQEDLLRIKRIAYKNPLYMNTLFSKDGKYATILIETQGFLKSKDLSDVNVFEGFESNPGSIQQEKSTEKEFITSDEIKDIITKVYQITNKYDAPDFQIYMTGSVAVNYFMSTALQHDVTIFLGLFIFTVIIILSIMFKRFTGVFLPITVAMFSLLSTLGLMVFFKSPVTLPVQVLPSFLMAIGVGYSMHILSLFYRNYDEYGNKENAIAHAFSHSGLAIILTAVTTACGVLSFTTVKLAPVISFGVYASAGVMFALLYTIILIPSLVSIIPVKRKKNIGLNQIKEPIIIDKTLTVISEFTIRHPYLILLISSFVLVFSVVGMMNIRFGHDIIRWMPEDSVLRKGTEKIDKVLYGSNVLDVVVNFKQKDSLYEPSVLNRLEESKEDLEKLKVGPIFVGKAWSVTSILKEINQALNNGQEEYYTIPQNKNLIAQEFLLFENSGSDDLAQYVDKEYSKARFQLKLPYLDAIYYGKFFDAVKKHFQANYPNAKITLTGIFKIYVQTFSETLISMARSYLFSMITVSILLLLFLGFRYGLLSLIPNFIPIAFSLGLMGWLHLPMNFSTMMVACIAIGIVVDDTIHFMSTFRKYFEKYNDTSNAIRMTFQTTGRPILMTSVVLTFSFMIFMLATLKNFLHFGLLTAVAMVMALLADFFLTPALLILIHKRRS